MANRIESSFTRKGPRSRKTLSKLSQGSPASKELIKRPISNYELPEYFLLRSPKREITSPYSTFISKKDTRSATPSLSSMSPKIFYFPNAGRSFKSKKLTIGLMPLKKENFRYNSHGLEESESYKNLNGVSTPPEEEVTVQRSVSPFSDIIDEQIRKYIDNHEQKIGKLRFDSPAYVEDSANYSTNESRKKALKYANKKKNNKRTPKAFSIMHKIAYENMFKLRFRKNK